MRGNFRAFEESVLPGPAYERAIRYVCYERHYYYRYAIGLGFGGYPLFYLDRFIGWRYDSGPEPLLPLHNGFADLLDTHVRKYLHRKPGQLREHLRDAFQQGHRVAVDLWWAPHADGIAGVTSALLEGMDDTDTVYFTKVNETRNRVCAPIALPELVRMVARDDDGLVNLTVIQDSAVIRELVDLSPARAFGRLFRDHYGYSARPDGLVRNGMVCQPGSAGLDEWIAHLESSVQDVIVDGAVPKPQQFRLSKAIHNCFVPIQYYLEYVVETRELARLLPGELVVRARSTMAEMEQALDNLRKFASLLVQQPENRFYGLYLNAARRLRDRQPAYQKVNLDILAVIEKQISLEAAL